MGRQPHPSHRDFVRILSEADRLRNGYRVSRSDVWHELTVRVLDFQPSESSNNYLWVLRCPASTQINVVCAFSAL